MTIRITGMNSGLDTDSIIQELVSAYRAKGDKIKKQQTKLSWTQDKWKSLNAKVLKLYKSLDNMRFSTGYNLKKTTVSDTTKAIVTASSSAVNGTQRLKIKKTATGGYLTGGKLENASKGSKTKVSDLLGSDSLSGDGTGTYRITGGGVDKYLKVGSDTTVAEFVDQINKAGVGVKASYDEANQRIFIVSKSTGEKNDFTLTATDENAAKALKALGVSTQSATSSAEAEKWMKYYKADGSGVDRTALETAVDALANAKGEIDRLSKDRDDLQKENAALTKAVNYVTAAKNKKEIEDKAGGSRNAASLSQLANMAEKNRDKDFVRGSDGTLVAATAADKADPTKEVVNGKALYAQLKAQYNSNAGFSEKKDVTDDKGNTTQVDTDDFKLIKAYNANNAAVKAYEDPAAGNAYVLGAGDDPAVKLQEYKDRIEHNTNGDPSDATKPNLKQINEDLAAHEATLKKYQTLDSAELTSAMTSGQTGFSDYVDELEKRVQYFKKNYSLVNGKYVMNGGLVSNGAHKEDGADAEIELNGAAFTSDSNTFNINGLTIQAQGVTGDADTDAITITTATDTQGLYDKIKDFLTDYNNIINEMSSLYNADSAKGYEPLTSEEKEALSESEISDWEKKIKDSLLRRDGNLSTLMNAMTSAMSKSFEINGKKYSLASLGIKTGSYFKTTAANRYEYHIDGDPDDDTTSAESDKLMAMLNSDPDTVIAIMQNATQALYKGLDDQMKTSTMRSFQSIYNDKAMAISYSDYTKKISAWEEKVSKIEDSYYKKFAAMETALSKIQSQQSAFAGMLGS